MIIVAAYLLVLVSVPICGGRLVKLGQLRIRKLWTINTALAIQILIVNIAEHQIAPSLGAAIHLASYALALVFLWANRRLPGLGVVVAGGLMNLAAIAANGGVMPASPGALPRQGARRPKGSFRTPLW